jgi:hypothetical protein
MVVGRLRSVTCLRTGNDVLVLVVLVLLVLLMVQLLGWLLVWGERNLRKQRGALHPRRLLHILNLRLRLSSLRLGVGLGLGMGWSIPSPRLLYLRLHVRLAVVLLQLRRGQRLPGQEGPLRLCPGSLRHHVRALVQRV